MTTQEINSQIKISRIKHAKFSNSIGYVLVSGYVLEHPKLGYLSFDSDALNVEGEKLQLPYQPLGGKKALQSIIDGGGMVHYNGISWISSN